MRLATELFDGTVEIDGLQTHVLRKGEGQKLLWLHGATGNLKWTPFLESLSQHFDVISPEHPGFGLSQRPNWFKDFEDLVYHYRSLLDYLSIDKAYVVGQSFGGWIAAEFAASQTHRVEKLVLTASTGLWIEGMPRTDTFMLTQEQLAEKSLYNKDFANAAVEKAKLPEEQELFIKNRVAHARYCWDRLSNRKFHRILKKIDVPTLIVWGERDEIISPKYAGVFAEYISNSNVKLIPECGHVPYVEKKDEYAKLLLDFLQDQ